MVDIGNIGSITRLYQDRAMIAEAVNRLSADQSVIAIGIGRRPNPAIPQLPATPFIVPTDYMNYPPQMIEAIKGMFQARLEAIDKELEGLGVNMAPEPEPEPQAAKRQRR